MHHTVQDTSNTQEVSFNVAQHTVWVFFNFAKLLREMDFEYCASVFNISKWIHGLLRIGIISFHWPPSLKCTFGQLNRCKVRSRQAQGLYYKMFQLPFRRVPKMKQMCHDFDFKIRTLQGKRASANSTRLFRS